MPVQTVQKLARDGTHAVRRTLDHKNGVSGTTPVSVVANFSAHFRAIG